MKSSLRTVVALLTATLLSLHMSPTASAANTHSPTPYAGQETRDIKALSPQEVESYLSGAGMGLAKAAELNGYPGPAHVLELAGQLALTPQQRTSTEALFAAMDAKAKKLGEALVAQERQLDQLFASKNITPELMSQTLAEIGALQARVRGAHLEAHLAQAAILTAGQNALYARLRGYHHGAGGSGGAGSGHSPGHGSKHKH